MEHILLTAEELRTLLKECVREELLKFTPAPAPSPQEEELINSKTAAKILSVSLVTLAKWRTEGKIKYYRISSRLRYKKSEILSALQSPLKFGRTNQ